MALVEGKTSRGVSVTTVLAIVALGVCGVLIYLVSQVRDQQAAQAREFEERSAQLERRLELIDQRLAAADAGLAELQSELQVTRRHVGLTETELKRAHTLAQQLKREQEKQVQALSAEIAQKAATEQVTTLEKEADNRFQGVSQDITEVRQEVRSSRQELEKTREELARMGVVVNDQGKMIATSASGLEELRRRTEREYVSFDARKKKRLSVAGIGIELRKADVKNHYADLKLYVDDVSMDKKKIYVNTPLTFYAGQQRIGYELVINRVEKDQIVGYLSLPQEKMAQGPPNLRR